MRRSGSLSNRENVEEMARATRSKPSTNTVINRNTLWATAAGALVALTLYSSPSLADEAPSTASKPESSSNAELAAKLANPSAPVLSLNFFLDVAQSGGSASDAHRATFRITLLPVLPFETKHGNLILRPNISAEFGQPYLNSAGNVETASGFGNLTLDSLFGNTLKNGLIIMGGAQHDLSHTLRPRSSGGMGHRSRNRGRLCLEEDGQRLCRDRELQVELSVRRSDGRRPIRVRGQHHQRMADHREPFLDLLGRNQDRPFSPRSRICQNLGSRQAQFPHPIRCPDLGLHSAT